MSLVIKSGESGPSFLVDEGVHTGILVGAVDLGVQKLLPYKGEERPDTRQIRLSFELPGLFVDSDKTKPAHVSKTVKISAHPKSTLFKISAALLGGGKVVEKDLEDGISVSDLLGRGAQVQVAHFETEKGTMAYISSVLPLPKGSKVGEPVSPLIEFDTHDPDSAVFDKLPESIKKKITEAVSLTSVKKSAKVELSDDEF